MSQPMNTEGGNLTTSDSRVTGGPQKFCCECGIDVTRRKRMKDSQGRYWCYECGTADQMRKGRSSTGSLCPDCMQTFPPVKLMRHENTYVCPECYETRLRRERERSKSFIGRLISGGGSGGAATADGAAAEAARQRKLLLALAVMAIITVLYYTVFA
jgi:predicted RNA-binding Zn-ribbon protein involved in translation (DUF1610 family)